VSTFKQPQPRDRVKLRAGELADTAVGAPWRASHGLPTARDRSLRRSTRQWSSL